MLFARFTHVTVFYHSYHYFQFPLCRTSPTPNPIATVTTLLNFCFAKLQIAHATSIIWFRRCCTVLQALQVAQELLLVYETNPLQRQQLKSNNKSGGIQVRETHIAPAPTALLQTAPQKTPSSTTVRYCKRYKFLHRLQYCHHWCLRYSLQSTIQSSVSHLRSSLYNNTYNSGSVLFNPSATIAIDLLP